ASVLFRTSTGAGAPAVRASIGTPLQLTLTLVAVNPDNLSDVTPSLAIRPGAPPILMQISSSTPMVGTPADTTQTEPGRLGPPSFIVFTPLSAGQTIISASSPILTPSTGSQVAITVDPSITLTPNIAIPAGFQAFVSFLIRSATPAISVRVSSRDPSRMVVSADPKQPGVESVTIRYSSGLSLGIYVQALASGDVPLTVSIPDEGEVSTAVHLSPPAMLATTGSTQNLSLAIGQSSTLSATVTPTDRRTSLRYLQNPGGPQFRLSLANSNPAA